MLALLRGACRKNYRKTRHFSSRFLFFYYYNIHRREKSTENPKKLKKPLDKPLFLCYNNLQAKNGSLVKRLRHGPLKAETAVRFCHESPQKSTPFRGALLCAPWLFACASRRAASGRERHSPADRSAIARLCRAGEILPRRSPLRVKLTHECAFPVMVPRGFSPVRATLQCEKIRTAKPLIFSEKQKNGVTDAVIFQKSQNRTTKSENMS